MGWGIQGLARLLPRGDYVAGAQPPARCSVPGGGFSARSHSPDSGAARFERVACAAGAGHGVSGIHSPGGRALTRGPGLSHGASGRPAEGGAGAWDLEAAWGRGGDTLESRSRDAQLRLGF